MFNINIFDANINNFVNFINKYIGRYLVNISTEIRLRYKSDRAAFFLRITLEIKHILKIVFNYRFYRKTILRFTNHLGTVLKYS